MARLRRDTRRARTRLRRGRDCRNRSLDDQLYERDDGTDPLGAYIDGALRLDPGADRVAARCWVGVLAEAVRDPGLFRRFRSAVDVEIAAIERRAAGALSSNGASALLAAVLGSLVLGAFAPRKTVGFAAPGVRAMLGGLLAR